MRIVVVIRKRWAMFVLVGLYAYLAVHTLSGSQGIASWVEYDAASARLAERASSMREVRTALERDALALSSNSLQLDVLDSRARRVLWASGDSDLVIPIGSR